MARQKTPYFTRLRFATAIIATGLMNLNIFGWSLKSVCTPGLNCHGCPWATAACPIGALTYSSAVRSIPVLALASIFAVGVVLGRLVCGFFCPFGLLQDVLHRLPGPKIKLPPWVRWGKYATLLLLVLVLPWMLGFEQGGYLMVAPSSMKRTDNNQVDLAVNVTNMGMHEVKGVRLVVRYEADGKKETYRQEKDFPDVTLAAGQAQVLPNFQVPDHMRTATLYVESPQSVIEQVPRYQLYFCKLCPAGTLTATVPRLFMRAGDPGWGEWVAGLGLRLGILVVLLALMVVASRPFCRMLCPLGALYALTPRVALTRLEVNTDACTQCGKCNEVCPMELNVLKDVGGRDCIACGDCKKACPQQGIRRVFGFGADE
jgi:ferredoxin